MTSEVVNLRERIEKVRAEMAGEDNAVLEDAESDDNFHRFQYLLKLKSMIIFLKKIIMIMGL